MKIKIYPSSDPPWEHTLSEGETVVGRSSDVDLPIADPFLSRKHALLSFDGETLTVSDLGSRNGTYVDGVQIVEPTAVPPGSNIRMSASRIEFGPIRHDSITQSTNYETDVGETIFRPASALLESDVGSSAEHLDSAVALRKYAEKLEILKDVHEALALSMDQDELLNLMLDRVFDHLQPQQGVIHIRRDDGGFDAAATRALPGLDHEISLSRTLVAEVLDKSMAALVFDAQTDSRFDQAESIMLSGVRSLLAAPILGEEGPIGMIVLSSTISARMFTEADLELLVSLAAVAAMKIRNQQLAAEAAQTRVLEEEIAKARLIQERALTVRELPSPEGYVFFGRNLPSAQVSGDFYQVILRADDSECVLFLADVSGHGIDASLLTMSMEALAAGPIELGQPPDELCTRLSRLLFKRTPAAKYATAIVVVLHCDSGRLQFTNAGHNVGLLIDADGEVEKLSSTGLPIGLLPDATYTLGEVALAPGSTLLLYTDGITEAADSDGEEYGLQRLQDCLSRCRTLAPEEIAKAIEKDLDQFVGETPFEDDRTMLILQRDSEIG